MRDDMEFNIQFIELIEQYPAIYDYTNSEYCNRSVQDKIWAEIGLKIGATAKDCKERWKNIRSCYSKYKKKLDAPSGSAAKTPKEYYLAQHLHFIDNFLKSRPPKGNLNSVVEANADGNEDDDDSRSMFGSPPRSDAVSEYITPRPTATLPLRNKSPQVTLKDVNLMAAEANKSVYEYFNQRNRTLIKDRTEDDPDMAFFRSMLPDIKSMTHAQKRRFKIGVLNLTEQILKNPIPTFYSYSRSESPYHRLSSENDSPVHLKSYASPASEQTQSPGAYGSPLPQQAQSSGTNGSPFSQQVQLSGSHRSPLPQQAPSSGPYGDLVPQQTQTSHASESSVYGGHLLPKTQTSKHSLQEGPVPHTQTSGPYAVPAPQQTQTSGSYAGPAPQQTQTSGAYAGPAPQQTQTSGAYAGPAPQQTQTSGAYAGPAPQQTQTSGAHAGPALQQTQTSGAYAGPAPQTQTSESYGRPVPQQMQTSLYLPMFSPITPFSQSYNLEE